MLFTNWRSPAVNFYPTDVRVVSTLTNLGLNMFRWIKEVVIYNPECKMVVY